MGYQAIGFVMTLLASANPRPQPPVLRLPDDVRPVRQSVELTVDPNSETLSGSVEIEIELRKATGVVWLNAVGLQVTSASLGRNGAMRPAEVIAGGEDFIGFLAGATLEPGPAVLRATFEGVVSRRDNEGVFAVQETGDFYLFTQFQAIAARRAFPCFDEPAHKIPWQVTLRVPHGLVALSNTPAVSTREERGQDVVRFSPTPPLPSYLVAFAVGPFDAVDVGPSGRNRTPTRLFVPRGRGPDTAWARESTPRLLELLEDYFDRPYPYAKLDQVAIPGAAFAMEHPGLVTYGQTLMVRRPPEDTVASRRDWASTCAHELAHQWFGNLVTMAWWDDTWLNESFASWLGEKIMNRFRPDWGVAVDRAASRSNALRQDSLATARRIRQPITSKDDIYNAFDGVTYGKGQAVLEMVEAWLGEEVFRRGVRAHIERHALGSASAADFIGALSGAAGREVGSVLATFLDQTGAPVLTADVLCGATPHVRIAQRPFRPLGSPAEPRTWSLPVCVRLAGREAAACQLLSAEVGEIPFEGGACPEWAIANAGATGYYRVAPSALAARRALQGSSLSAAERVALAGDLGALVASGDVAASDALDLVPLLARDSDRQVIGASAALVRELEPLVPDALVPRFRGIVRELYAERAGALGWVAGPGESENARLMRKSLVSVAARVGRDSDLEREAVARAVRWLVDPTALDPDLVSTALAVAAGASDRAVFELLRSEARRTNDRGRRELILEGLGAARDPELVKLALELTLDEQIDPRESVWLLWALGSQRETRRAAFDFLKARYADILARLPQGEMSPAPYLPWVAAGLCTPDARQEIEEFFGRQSAAVMGAPRVLAQALEAVDQCVARKRAQAPGLAAYLEARPEP